VVQCSAVAVVQCSSTEEWCRDVVELCSGVMQCSAVKWSSEVEQCSGSNAAEL
jgi:hypothetical protein